MNPKLFCGYLMSFWIMTNFCFGEGHQLIKIKGESLVLANGKPAKLCFDSIVNGSLALRSTFEPGGTVYLEGCDYLVNYEDGTIIRTSNSRIPDYSKHPLYGKTDFDHKQLPYKDCFNHKWFVWADYQTTNGKPWAETNDQRRHLNAIRRKLETGGTFKIVSYGDSITAGGEITKKDYIFTQRFAQYLRTKFPKTIITLTDVSIPGYTSSHAISWFDEKPQSLMPRQTMGTIGKTDLVLIGFGMNDHNKDTTSPEQFKANLITLVKMIRERNGAEVIIFSACPPNDDWHYSSHRMELFAEKTKEAALETGSAYVAVYETWKMVLKRKDQSSLLGNNINHPNNFGHWLYAQAFQSVEF